MIREGLRARTVLLTGVAAAVLSWLLGRWWLAGGHQPVQVTWLAALLLLAMAVVVLAMGRRMWRYRHRGAPVEPLVAARILGLAQASALTGAVTAGCYLGQALLLLPDLDFASWGQIALRHAAAALGATLVAVAGLVVQGWCRVVDPDDTDPSSGAADAGSGPERPARPAR